MKKSRTILTILSMLCTLAMGIVISDKWSYLGKAEFEFEEIMFLIFLGSFLFSIYLRFRFKI